MNGILIGCIVFFFVIVLISIIMIVRADNEPTLKTLGTQTSSSNKLRDRISGWMPSLEQKYWKWTLFWGTAGLLIFVSLWAWDEAGYSLTHDNETYIAYGNGSSMSIDQCPREEKLSPPAGGFPLYLEVASNAEGVTLDDLKIYVQTYKRTESGDLVRYGRANLYKEGQHLTECTIESFSLILKPNKATRKSFRIDQGIVYFRIDTTQRCSPHTGELYVWTRES